MGHEELPFPMRGHRQITDIYLLGLAVANGGRISLKAAKGATPSTPEWNIADSPIFSIGTSLTVPFFPFAVVRRAWRFASGRQGIRRIDATREAGLP